MKTARRALGHSLAHWLIRLHPAQIYLLHITRSSTLIWLLARLLRCASIQNMIWMRQFHCFKPLCLLSIPGLSEVQRSDIPAEFLDELIFHQVDWQGNRRHLTAIQELQLLDILCTFFQVSVSLYRGFQATQISIIFMCDIHPHVSWAALFFCSIWCLAESLWYLYCSVLSPLFPLQDCKNPTLFRQIFFRLFPLDLSPMSYRTLVLCKSVSLSIAANSASFLTCVAEWLGRDLIANSQDGHHLPGSDMFWNKPLIARVR